MCPTTSWRIRISFYANLLVPWVLVTKVLPRLRMLNMAGALTSYQSFLEKGSTLENEEEFIYLHKLIDQTGICYLSMTARNATVVIISLARQCRWILSDLLRNLIQKFVREQASLLYWQLAKVTLSLRSAKHMLAYNRQPNDSSRAHLTLVKIFLLSCCEIR